MSYQTPERCPECGSFAWDYDDTVVARDADGSVLYLDTCRCDDCGHEWAVDTRDDIRDFIPDDEDDD